MEIYLKLLKKKRWRYDQFLVFTGEAIVLGYLRGNDVCCGWHFLDNDPAAPVYLGVPGINSLLFPSIQDLISVFEGLVEKIICATRFINNAL